MAQISIMARQILMVLEWRQVLARLGIPRDKLGANQWLVLSIVLLYPALAATVKHSGGVALILLVVAGLFQIRPVRAQLTPAEKRLFLGFLAFLLISCLSMINTEDFRAAGYRIERYAHLPLAFFAYLALRGSGLNISRALVAGLVAAAYVYFAVGIAQTVFLGEARADGAYYAILFGDLAILFFFLIAAALLSLDMSNGEKYVAAGGMICALGASFLSGTKGAWIFIPVGLTILLLSTKFKFSIKHIVTGLVVVTLVGVAIFSFKGAEFAPVKHLERQLDSLSTGDITQSESTFSARISLWRDAYLIWKESPLLGTGLGDFRKDSDRLLEQGISYPRRNYDHAHNIFMDVLAISGIVGLIALVVLVFAYPLSFFFQGLRDGKMSAEQRFFVVGGILTVAAFVVFGLTEGWLSRNPFVRSYVLFLLVFIYGLMMSRRHASQSV